MQRAPRLSLAHLPTPVQRLERLSASLGLDVMVKRDDLTGSHLSGNKVRKLEYLLGQAQAEGATHVLTCGGVQSNHCRATALAASPLGMQPVLLLRTPGGRPDELPEPPSGNVLLDRLAGAELRLCDPEGYRRRETLLEELAAEVRGRGGRPFIIPEGGSNAVGALGYVRCADELARQLPGGLPDTLVVATGSGGTVAGLALGLERLGAPTRVLGVAVCDDAATFRAIVDRIALEAHERFGLPPLPAERYDIVEGFVGRGYALSTPEELQFLRDTARLDGLVLDPVYTLKALAALLGLAATGSLGRRTMFLHTGGIFGLLAIGAELAPHL